MGLRDRFLGGSIDEDSLEGDSVVVNRATSEAVRREKRAGALEDVLSDTKLSLDVDGISLPDAENRPRTIAVNVV